MSEKLAMTKEAYLRALEQVQEPCPCCGEPLVILWHQSPDGERSCSLCCGASAALVENYELFSALPVKLQQLALDQDRERLKAMDEAADERARLRAEWDEECKRRWPHLFYGTLKQEKGVYRGG